MGVFFLINLHFHSCSAGRVASSSLLVGKEEDELMKNQVIKHPGIKKKSASGDLFLPDSLQ